jgi:putative ABC transport system substrate-binding protein
MRRRECILLLGGAAILWPLHARAQAKGPARIGFLGTDSLNNPEAKVAFDAFLQGLRELGYVEGENVTIEYRESGGNWSRLPDLAHQLSELHVDVILAPNTPAARAAQRATATIPIVVAAMGDPVSDGLVKSLARPGANITGFTFLGPELVPKRLALLKEMLPRVSRIAGLVHPDAYPQHTMNGMLDQAVHVADTLGLRFQVVQVRSRDELDRAFATITAEALFQFPSPMFYNSRKRIVALATKHRLPAIFVDRKFVELGGLMSYGAGVIDLFRNAATYVDRIFKGIKPSELPVEQPTKFELVINLMTAKALGVAVPPLLLAQADHVIEKW